MRRAVLALLVLVAACDGDTPPEDAGGLSDSGPPPVDTGPHDAGPPPPVCEGEWIEPFLGDPMIEASAPILSGEGGSVVAPVSQVRLRARTLRSDEGRVVSMSAVPVDRFVWIRVERDRPPALHWEPVGRGFALARFGPGALGRVRYFGPMEPADKVDPRMVVQTEQLEVSRWVDGALRVERLPRAGADVDALTRDPDVLTVTSYMPEEPTLDTSRIAAGVDDVQRLSVEDGLPAYAGLTGRFVRAAVADTGIVATHPDLQDYGPDGELLGTRVIGYGPELGDDEGRHATLVSGFLAGNGWLSDGATVRRYVGTPFEWRGVAPGIDTLGSVVSVADPTPWNTAFIELACHLSNNSHTQSAGDYSRLSLWWDQMGYSGAASSAGTSPPRIVVFSQGNNGAFWSHRMIPLRGYWAASSPGKNPVTVGGANANDDTHAAPAAAGPTLDGRLKPDIVAGGYVDWRPPDGAQIALDEVRLVAIPGGGGSDIVWTPDSTDPDWTLSGDLARGTVSGGRLVYQSIGSGWLTYDPTDPIDATQYDRMRASYEVLDAGDPTMYEPPDRWAIRWDTNGDDRFNRQNWPSHDIGDTNVSLERVMSNWDGTPHAFSVNPTIWFNQSVVLSRDGGYTMSGGGTSFSAPIVAGVAALLLEQLRESFGYDLDASPPLPSLVKALLIHTATDLIRLEAPRRDPVNPDTMEALIYHADPDWPTGYGLVNAARATGLLGTHRDDARRYVEQPEIEDGTVHVYTIRVAEDAGPLRATLVWDDFPGSPLLAPTERQLINDLDIVAISPRGVAHSPWMLTQPPRNPDPLMDGGIDPITTADIVPATRCAETDYWQGDATVACEDHLNNVEQVLVDDPAPGEWTIRIRAQVVEGPQSYSLVVDQACSAP